MERRKKVFASLLTGFLLLAVSVSVRAAINRGNIEGTVTDPQGAVVPGVTVTVTNVDTNVTTTSPTNEAGYYLVPELVPGPYTARFEITGFQSVDTTGIEVIAGRTHRVDAQLSLGLVTETVEVTSAAPLLETAASNFSTTLESRVVQEIPLAGRDIQNVVFLLPGVTQVAGPPGSNFGFNSAYGTFPDPLHVFQSVVSVSGGQAGANAWYLDGNLNMATIGENVVVSPSPDAVGEFQAVNNSFAAEYSRTGGAVFSMTLKSGANQFHGNIYEYLRNDATNSRNPFTSIDADGNIIKERQLRYNNFGGTVGGPIVKDKTHFFFSWDVSTLNIHGQKVFTVPTPLMKRGDFSEVPNAAEFGLWDPFSSQGPDSQGLFRRQQIMNADGTPATAIPSNMIDPIAQFYMDSFPAPNFNNNANTACPRAASTGNLLCDNFLGNHANSQNTHNISIKLDHVMSEKSKWFGEWLYNPTAYRFLQVPWTGATFPSRQVGFNSNLPFDVRNQVIALGNTYTLGPTLINEFRASFTRQFMTSFPEQPFDAEISDQPRVQELIDPVRIPGLGSQFPVPSFGLEPPIAGSSGRPVWGPVDWVNGNQATQALTIMNNVTKISGNHTLKGGFMYRLDHAAHITDHPVRFTHAGRVSANPITGQGAGGGYAQFLMGAMPADYVYGESFTGRLWDPRQRWRSWGFYFQDDWRVTQKLTLNIGIRWDIYGYYKIIQGGDPYPYFESTMPNPDAAGLPGTIVYNPANQDLFPPHWDSFAPRFNFSYRVDEKTVVRGGYNMFFSNIANSRNAAGQGPVNAAGWNQSILFSKNLNGDLYNATDGAQGCAHFNRQCPSFRLSDTTTDKAIYTFPPLGEGYPGQLSSPQLATWLNRIDFKEDGPPRVQQWNLQIERQLPGDILFSIAYVGTHGTRLANRGGPLNRVHTDLRLQYRARMGESIPIRSVYGGQQGDRLAEIWEQDSLTREQLLCPFPMFGCNSLYNGGGYFDGSNVYHGLHVKFQKRFSQGLSFIGVYTWHKNVTYAFGNTVSNLVNPIHWARGGALGGRSSGHFWNGGAGGGFQNPDDRQADRTISPDDIPQLFNLAVVYELPFGDGKPFLSGKGKIVNALLGGWRVTPNFNAQGGIPLPANGPCNEITCRTNLLGDAKGVGRSKEARIKQWFNPAALEPVYGNDTDFWANYDPTDDRAWQWGNAGLRIPSMRAPGFWNLDTGLAKEFRIDETRYFEFRWEMYNALNHQNLALPNVNWCLPPGPNGETDRVRQAGCSFGLITNIQTDPRAHQFALKFFF